MYKRIIIAVLLLCVFCFSSFAYDFDSFTKVKPKLVTGRTGVKSLAGNADDPAIWIHPTDKSRSLIFGVDKSEGVWVWTLDGKELTHFDPIGKPGNVDVRYNFQLGGKLVDIVGVNLRKVKYKGGSKVALYAINPDYTSGDDVLTTLCDGRSDNNDISLSTYGFCLYQNPKDGKMYIFEAADTEPYIPKQHLIEDDGTGKGVKVTLVRELDYSGDVNEGMVADDESGFVYIAEEGLCVYKYNAEPDASPKAVSSFAYNSDGFSADREGVAIYKVDEKRGYIIVCDQGGRDERTPSIFRIYDREGDNKLLKTIVHLGGKGKNVWDDDGVAANSTALPGFPHGIVIGHDGDAANHPIYDWADFAEDDLLKANN